MLMVVVHLLLVELIESFTPPIPRFLTVCPFSSRAQLFKVTVAKDEEDLWSIGASAVAVATAQEDPLVGVKQDDSTGIESDIDGMNQLQNEEQDATDSCNSDWDKAWEARPDVCTLVTDKETGRRYLQSGKYVMDVITRKAVVLHDDPVQRMEQFLVVPRTMQQSIFHDTPIEQRIQALKDAFYLKGTTKLPPYPSATRKAVDFCRMHRHLLAERLKQTLVRMSLRATSLEVHQLLQHLCLIENHLSAPFRQLVSTQDRVLGKNFGNLDVSSYISRDTAPVERAAYYVALKSWVAKCERHVRDAEVWESYQRQQHPGEPFVSKDMLSTLGLLGGWYWSGEEGEHASLYQATQVAIVLQQMSRAFTADSYLWNDEIPVELRYIEVALSLKTSSELRRYTTQEFLPSEGISFESLYERLERFLAQLENMAIQEYGEFRNLVEHLRETLWAGMDSGNKPDPYKVYLGNFDRVNGSGGFPSSFDDLSDGYIVSNSPSSGRIIEEI